MVKELFDRQVFIYIMLGLCVFGILLKAILDIVYKRLIRASDNMGTSKNKLTQMMKKKFETCYKLKIGVNNVDIFVDKYVYHHRFGGILLSTWENIGGQVLMLCLLTGSISAVLGLIYECGKQQILSTFSVGILTSGLLIFLEGIINIAGKKELIRLNMKDYLENFFKVRLEQELLHPELIEKYKKELLTQESEGLTAVLNASGEFASGARKGRVLKADKKLSKRQRKEALRMEKEQRKAAAKADREDRKTEKKLAKLRKQEEIERKRIAARELQERLQTEAKLALERKREEEREEIARRKAEAKAEEERRKEEKYRQEEVKRALQLEKHTTKEEKQKRSSEHKTIAQERKENLLKEIKERRSLEGHEPEAVQKTAEAEEIQDNLQTIAVTVAPDTVAAAESPKTEPKSRGSKRVKLSDPMEEKLIEDILKEFLA